MIFLSFNSNFHGGPKNKRDLHKFECLPWDCLVPEFCLCPYLCVRVYVVCVSVSAHTHTHTHTHTHHTPVFLIQEIVYYVPTHHVTSSKPPLVVRASFLFTDATTTHTHTHIHTSPLNLFCDILLSLHKEWRSERFFFTGATPLHTHTPLHWHYTATHTHTHTHTRTSPLNLLCDVFPLHWRHTTTHTHTHTSTRLLSTCSVMSFSHYSLLL